LLNTNDIQNSKQMRFKIILILFIALSINIFAQDNQNLTFNDGIFISFNDFKQNQSIAFSQIISNKPIENDIKEFLKKKKINYFDNNGIQQELKTKNIWGYCYNNKIYIHYNNEYNIIPIIGSISHFIANKQVYTQAYSDPFQSPYSYNDTYKTSEPQEYILDINSGAVYEFNIKNFLLLLSKDNDLYTEFIKLKKRQQRQMIYIYLRRFNEKHRITLPNN